MLTMFLGFSLAGNLMSIFFTLWCLHKLQRKDKVIKIYSDSREWYRMELFCLFNKYLEKLKCNQAEEVEKFLRSVEEERENCIKKNENI